MDSLPHVKTPIIDESVPEALTLREAQRREEIRNKVSETQRSRYKNPKEVKRTQTIGDSAIVEVSGLLSTRTNGSSLY